MRTLRHRTPRPGQRGAALLLSLLVLLVLVAIVIQINVSTNTDARVARNDVGLTAMDLAIESAFLQSYEQLKADGEAGAASGAGGAGGAGGAATGAGAGAPAGGGAAAAGQGQQAATDSRRDEWAQVARTEINEIKLRILVQDEDSKINVLNLLNPDEKEAKAAFDRIARCLDMCRDGTLADIPERTAEEMTRGMLEFMRQRNLAKLPRPKLLTDNEQDPDVGLPLGLRDFAVLPSFDDSLFRDFRDADGRIVHSIGSFLTVWTSLSSPAAQTNSAGPAGSAGAASAATGAGTGAAGTGASGTGGASAGDVPAGGGAPGGASGAAGGGAGAAPGAAAGIGGAGAAAQNQSSPGWTVNVNTAPVAVLKSLFDDREVHMRVWDKVIEYRNLEEEKKDGEKDDEKTPTLDEFGDEVLERKIFDTLAELSEVDGFNDLDTEIQAKIKERLTTQSQVFSIFVVARRTTSADGDAALAFSGARGRRLAEEQGDALVRVARSVVWRRSVDDKVEIVPIVRFEWLDYIPFEVQDYPDDER